MMSRGMHEEQHWTSVRLTIPFGVHFWSALSTYFHRGVVVDKSGWMREADACLGFLRAFCLVLGLPSQEVAKSFSLLAEQVVYVVAAHLRPPPALSMLRCIQ